MIKFNEQELINSVNGALAFAGWELAENGPQVYRQ